MNRITSYNVCYTKLLRVLVRVDDELGYLQWLSDGRLLLIEGDGKDARWIDPDGGPTTARGISYCIMAAPLPDP